MFNYPGWANQAKKNRYSAINAVIGGLTSLQENWNKHTIREIRDILDDICQVLQAKKPE